jgi:diguanylate cyclase (GGDEF)-like protein/PAS domain S-box-containing protein
MTGGGAVRVLLVEDSAADAQLVVDALAFARRPGFAVRHAARLSEAVEALHRERFDVVVLDLGLPDAAGLDGLATIRRAAPNVAIVVRTVLGDERIAIDAIESGAQDYIVKRSPDQDEGLERSIRYALARRQAEVSQRQLAAIVESTDDAIVGKDTDGTITSWNSGAERLYGYAAEDAIGQPVAILIAPERAGEEQEILARVIAGERVEHYETQRTRRDKSTVEVSLTISPIADAAGILVGASAIARDITERKHAESALREAEERFRGTFENSGIGMAVVAVASGHAGRLLEINDALCALSGYERDQLLQMSFDSLVHPDELPAAIEGIDQLLRGELKTFHHELRCTHASGDHIWVDLTTSLVRDADGEPLYRIDQIQDITERKRFEGQLQYLADHDALTGLFNRRRFLEELYREVAAASRYGNPGALLALDLDHFKYINDSLGHAAGDELIARIAAVFRARLRGTDILARLGGDEFAIILPRADEQQAQHVAESLLAAARDEVVHVDIGHDERRVTVSIGIAPFHHGDELTAEELLLEADIAMYDSKDAGRDKITMYDAAQHRQQRMQARLTWSDRIHRALESDGFVLHAQPILGLNGDQRPRHELLLRLVGNDGDLIPPGTFLHIAERFGLAQEVDRWVVKHAIDLLAEHQRADSDVCLEVNLSAHSVTNDGLIELITERLAAANADPRGLCFELTETAAIINVDRARSFARELANLGCEFALDDFGAGFASFHYLKHLQFDYIKIDGEFIKDLPSSHTNQLIVRAVVQMAKGLGKKTIAEFVEDQETLELLRPIGVDYAQGYHIAKPGPFETTALANTPARASTQR